jgi:hypothetical protein
MKCQHEWNVAASKISTGQACPKCGRVKAGLSRRVTANEWNRRAAAVGIEWLESVELKETPTLARCMTCSYEWRPVPNHITGGHGCPNCAGVRAYLPDEWREFADHVGLDLHNEPENQRGRADLTCRTCGHSYSTTAAGLVIGKGCPACAGNLKLPQDEWEHRGREAGYDVLELVESGGTPTRAQCRVCGLEFRARLNSKSGCPACAEYGFNPGLPSIVYLLRHTEDGALKIGIAKAATKKPSWARLSQHQRQGWETIRVWTCTDGYTARSVEQSVLRWWRDELGLPPYHDSGSGWTETVDGDRVSVDDIVAFVEDEQAKLLGED